MVLNNVKVAGWLPLCLVVTGCAGARPGPRATPPTQFPIVTVARLEEAPLPPDYNCAASPAVPLVDTASPKLGRVAFKIGPQTVVEEVTFVDGQILSLRHGGCAHYGYAYDMKFPEGARHSKRERVSHVLALLQKLPLIDGEDGGIPTITERLNGLLKSGSDLETCHVGDEQLYMNVQCEVYDEADHTLVRLILDIVL